MHGIIGIAAAGALGLSAPIEWQYLGEARTGTIWYYDPASVQVINPAIVQVWAKLDTTKDKTEHVAKVLVSQQINCQSREVATVTSVTYDATGRVQDSHTVPDYRREWTPIVPETMISALASAVCPRE